MKLPKIVGIVNVTPDSFYDGGRYDSTKKAIEHGIHLFEQGANILDIGGESTRPPQIYQDKIVSASVTIEEELNRVIPVIEQLKDTVSIPLSIDTRKPEVAKKALEAGATILNDVGGFRSEAMCELAAEYNVPICVMHMQGTPETMQDNPQYKPDVVSYLLDWFEQKVEQLVTYGIEKKNIILDPGICFGKTLAHNIEILQNLHKIRDLGFPMLVGASRKSFLQKILGKPSDQTLAGTLATSTFLCMQGVDYLRVHDVAEHVDTVRVLEALSTSQKAVLV